MSFVSPEFALLALLFFPLYWSLSAKRTVQQALLAITGYALYATWSMHFALVLLVYSTCVWGLGPGLSPDRLDQPNKPDQGNVRTRRQLLLRISLALGVGFLALVKYYEFTRQLIQALLIGLGINAQLPLVDVLAPAGVSFFTFQAISYWVGIYQGKLAPQSLFRVHLLMSFWPTLFAGPIFRAEHFFPQLDSPQAGRPWQVERAIYLLLLGLVQKLVLSSWLASTFVDAVFKYPEQASSVAALAAMLAYSLQIFFDFAGYTLIVTGLGLLLGYQLPENFRQPYLAADLQQFWQRWHISLSSFIRDYIYIPLGGNQHGFARAQLYLLLAMLISGLWHGASFSFIVWGLLHGVGVMWVRLRKQRGKAPLPYGLANACTLLFVALAWVFFRAPTLADAYAVLARLWSFDLAANLLVPSVLSLAGLLGLTVSLLWLSPRAQNIERIATAQLATYPVWLRVSVMVYVLTFCLLAGPSGVPGFIYYQF